MNGMESAIVLVLDALSSLKTQGSRLKTTILYFKMFPLTKNLQGEIVLRVMVKKEAESHLCGEVTFADDYFGEGKLKIISWIEGDAKPATCWQKHPGVNKLRFEIILATCG